VLRLMGILQYTPRLAAFVDSKQELAAGCPEESAIRAASIVAVERLKERVNGRLAQQEAAAAHQAGAGRGAAPAAGGEGGGEQLLSIHLDWWLWNEGERMREQHPPHHRTRTIYY